jgi:NAD(P)H-flavin reductase/ferredoxin
MRVTVQPFDDTIDTEPGEPVLAAILRQGRFVRYGCKHGGCGTCRAEVVEGDYRLGDNTSFALSDSDRAGGQVLLCSTIPAGDELVVDVSGTMPDLTAEEYHRGQSIGQYTGTVDRIDTLTPDIRWLGLQLDEPMPFTAGQYLEIEVPGRVDTWRSYSMANAPARSGRADLIIKLFTGGLFSTVLNGQLRLGDRLAVRGPLGAFGVRLSHRPMVLVAGGSGVAPIRSMLTDLAETGNRREVTCFYGARTVADLVQHDELVDLAARHAWLTYVPAVTTAAAGLWSGDVGLVTDVLARRLPATSGREAYLCGPPGMVDAAIEVLTSSGCKPRHIYVDRFVPSG